MSKESLKIGELVVLDFRTEHLTDAISGWRNRTHVPYAESCARQVWYGDSSTFSSFPIKNQKQQDYAFYEGVKGYRRFASAGQTAVKKDAYGGRAGVGAFLRVLSGLEISGVKNSIM